MNITTTITEQSTDFPGYTEQVRNVMADVEGVHGPVGFEADATGCRTLYGTPVVRVSTNLATGSSSVWTSHVSFVVNHAISEDDARTIVAAMVTEFAQHGWDADDWQTPVQWALDFVQVFVFDGLGRDMAPGYHGDVWSGGPALDDFIAEYVTAVNDANAAVDGWVAELNSER